MIRIVAGLCWRLIFAFTWLFFVLLALGHSQQIPIVVKNGVTMYQPDKPFASVTLQDCKGPGCPVVINADVYCAHATADETCISNALASVGNTNARIMLGPRTYNFGSDLQLTGLTNVVIEGTGPASVIRKDGISLECTNCSNVKVANLAFQTVTVPTVVLPASLPTGNPATVVVIDRNGTGSGYIPTVNDGDVVPTGSGGSCTVKCLSAAQSNELFDTGLVFHGGSFFEVSGLSGSYFSITFFDVSSVSVHDNFVSGGKQFAGIAFWTASGSSPSNHNIVITGNTVQYAAFSGILMGGGDHYEVAGNQVNHNGESGVKTYQGTPLQVSYADVTGNNSSYNYYDGFDLSSTFPHVSTFSAYSVASGNHADHNHGTGFYADGKFWTFTGNQATANGAAGMGLDFCESTIAGNQSTGNNTLATAGLNQLSVSGNVSCGGNLVVANHTDTTGNVGNGLYAGGSPSSTVIGNIEQTGISTINTANVGGLNSDSTGMLPASMLALRSTGLVFRHAGGTEIDAASAGGYFNVTIPANTGSLAMTNLSQNWSGVQGYSNGTFVFHHAGTTELDAASLGGFFNVTIPANTGTLAMTNLTQTWTGVQTFTNGISGPSTAPSGACSTVEWVFSQDGHATFCNGTTWVSKI